MLAVLQATGKQICRLVFCFGCLGAVANRQTANQLHFHPATCRLVHFRASASGLQFSKILNQIFFLLLLLTKLVLIWNLRFVFSLLVTDNSMIIFHKYLKTSLASVRGQFLSQTEIVTLCSAVSLIISVLYRLPYTLCWTV